tara:strand:+ start:102 stop:569 length:468 start_codon:yes stop_codon:yes gene_type:complete
MFFRHNADNTFEINGVKIDYETFVRVEPDYVKKEGVLMVDYTPASHHILYTDTNQYAGPLPWEDGDRYINRLADFKEMQKIVDRENREDEKSILLAFRERSENEKKEKKQPIDPTVGEMVTALWEMIVEGSDDSEILKIQERRDAFKQWKRNQVR